MHILVASSSAYRQGHYRDAIMALGHQVTQAKGGVDCVEQLFMRGADMLILEAPLLWGGTDGVLEVAQGSGERGRLPVILVAVGVGSIDWFQLSRFRVDDLLFRVPSAAERCAGVLSGRAASKKLALRQLRYECLGTVRAESAPVGLRQQVNQLSIASAGAAASVQVLQHGAGNSIGSGKR